MKKQGTEKINIPSVILTVLTAAAVLYCTFLAYSYTGIKTALVFFLIASVLTVALYLLGRKYRKTSVILGILFLVILVVLSFAGHKTDTTLSATQSAPEYDLVQIIVMKDSNISEEDDFRNYKMGYTETDLDAFVKAGEILKEHEKKIYKAKPQGEIKTAYEKLKENKVQLLVLTGMSRSELEEDYPDYRQVTKVLFEKKIPLEEAKAKYVDIEKEPCVIYLQGADLSSGDNIHSTGRGDCNILLTINPDTGKTGFQVIPRDTFVNIKGLGGRSKLSYSGGWGGIQSSIESIEEEFDIDINFYAKINFKGVTDLVDGLGGVNVYSQYDFYSGGYHFVKGYNEVNGDQALKFVTERKSLPQNELSRGKNQMAMVKAILGKFAEDPDYDTAVKLVNSLSDNFVTNIPKKDYLKTFNVVVKLLPSLMDMDIESMEGEYRWHTDEVRTEEYRYYFYPAEGEKERVKQNIEKIKSGK